MIPSAPPDVFLSYAREDRSYADLLRGYLLARDRSVWSDDELQPGADRDEELTRSLEASGTVILIVSPAFLRSQWCLYEAGVALAKQRKNEGRVIPIVVGAVDLDGLPVSLRRAGLVDARSGDERRLLRDVEALLAERPEAEGAATRRHN